MENQIREKLDEIAHVAFQESGKFDNSLLGGKAGIALFLFYLSQVDGYHDYREKALTLLETVYEEGCPADPTYARGAAGIVWLMIHLTENGFIEYDYKDGLTEIVTFLMDTSDDFSQRGNYDFLHGLGGFLVALNEGKSNYKEEIKQLTERFLQLGEWLTNNDGFIWKSYDLEEMAINNRVELGLAHGLSANINILLKVNEMLQDKQLSETTLAALRFLKNTKNDRDILSVFPDSVELGEIKTRYSRLAWCNGDLCVALTCQLAGGNENIQLTENILNKSLNRRDLMENSVYDAGFCHGTSGLAHIYNRQFVNTGHLEYRQAADYWMKQTLAQAYHKEGLAGYKSLQGVEQWYNEAGLLNGISGIGLTMLGFLNREAASLDWDSVLLIS